MDILVQWPGKDFAEQTSMIGSINIKYPETSLKKIWDKLEVCYSSAEAIESALFKRIEHFPKISPRGITNSENKVTKYN